MREEDLLRTLSSSARQRILACLTRGPRDVEAIAQEVRLKPTTVRYHLLSLMRLGLVEAHQELQELERAGRPKILYRLGEKQVSLTFPKRQYLSLVDALIGHLQGSLDSERVNEIFTAIGKEQGRDVAFDLTLKNDVERWTPDLFCKYYIDFLREYGVQPELVQRTSREIVYRTYNCPFKEMAIKYPKLICDILDQAFHDSVCRSMDPRVRSRRIKCVAHGEPYCEHSVEWPE